MHAGTIHCLVSCIAQVLYGAVCLLVCMALLMLLKLLLLLVPANTLRVAISMQSSVRRMLLLAVLPTALYIVLQAALR